MIPTKHINEGGTEFWESPNGAYHREDGPAIIWADDRTCWCINGKYHREDGPAVIRHTGTKEWHINGELHREDGPAVTYTDGSVEWWLHDGWYLFDMYCYTLKSVYGKTDEDIMMLTMKYG